MKNIFSVFALITLLSACSGMSGDTSSFPKNNTDQRRDNHGKLTDDSGGIKLFGGGSDESEKGGAGIGVNSFLWRATLDTIGFMPINQADPFGGVITTDWYEDAAAKGERIKINALILDEKLRADGITITTFKQKLDAAGNWRDVNVDKSVNRQLEDKILSRARELRINQTGK